MTHTASSVQDTLYIPQVHALDDGGFDSYAATFTTDAVFGIRGAPAPLSGRDAIVEHSRTLRAKREACGEVQRHYMWDVHVVGSTVIATVLAVVSKPGAAPRIAHLIRFIDTVIPHADRLLVVARSAKIG